MVQKEKTPPTIDVGGDTMKKNDTERKVETNGVPDFKAIPKAVLEPVIETLLANMLAYFKENKEE